jgi:chorismate-pyruvate lyase
MPSPSLPLRMLLTTDGSVTPLLEASFDAPVAVETLTNTLGESRPRSLHRTAVLRLAGSGRPLLRANSVLAVDRMPEVARDALLEGAAPIGTVLRDARLETRRELKPYTEDTATAEDAAALGVDEGSPVFERTYRIVSFSRELAVVTERFPASLFADAEAA